MHTEKNAILSHLWGSLLLPCCHDPTNTPARANASASCAVLSCVLPPPSMNVPLLQTQKTQKTDEKCNSFSPVGLTAAAVLPRPHQHTRARKRFCQLCCRQLCAANPTHESACAELTCRRTRTATKCTAACAAACVHATCVRTACLRSVVCVCNSTVCVQTVCAAWTAACKRAACLPTARVCDPPMRT